MRHGAIQVTCVLAVILGASLSACGVEFAGGTGEPNDPYLISTPDQFLAADFNQVGVYFRLSNDIDLAGQTVAERTLRCHLDGGGHKIRDMRLFSSYRHDLYRLGLFHVMQDGVVANVALVDAAVATASGDQKLWGATLGALASINSGTITDCSATGMVVVDVGNIYDPPTYQGGCLGGLVGINYGVILNCSFDGWVSGSWEGDDVRGPRAVAGGLVGRNEGTISRCYATGTVVADTSAGGLTGGNVGSIDCCYSWARVFATSGAGGLVAYNGGHLRRCYAVGPVTGEMRGGLVGMANAYWGEAVECLWDKSFSGCATSGAGLGTSLYAMPFAFNGWGGDPNWMMDSDPNLGMYGMFPRLSWEGTGGTVLPVLKSSQLLNEGSGTAADPYRIGNANTLLAVCQSSIYWDKHFVLVADIDLGSAGSNYSPIGTSRGSPFAGTFDGNGHVIRGLEIDTDDASAWNFGIFSYVTGQIKNLGVVDMHLTTGQHSQWVGLLAGYCAGTLENCYATGSITVGEDSKFVGGLVGYAWYCLTNCQATVTVVAGEGSTYIGELAGQQPTRGCER